MAEQGTWQQVQSREGKGNRVSKGVGSAYQAQGTRVGRGVGQEDTMWVGAGSTFLRLVSDLSRHLPPATPFYLSPGQLLTNNASIFNMSINSGLRSYTNPFVNKLTRLRRCLSQVHFAKIHLGKIHFENQSMKAVVSLAGVTLYCHSLVPQVSVHSKLRDYLGIFLEWRIRHPDLQIGHQVYLGPIKIRLQSIVAFYQMQDSHIIG